MNKKLNQISFLSVFAMILVVIGHSHITLEFRELWIFKWVYTFHMPLFFLISGFLYAYTNPKGKLEKINSWQFIGKKVKRLLYPFFFINSIIFIIKALAVNEEQMQHPLSFDFQSYINSMLFHPIGFMWFLPALFVIFVLFISFKRYVYNRYFPVGVIVLFAISFVFPEVDFFEISSAVYFSGYFALGIVYCRYKEYVDRFLLKYRYVILLVSFVISTLLLDNQLIAALVGIAFSIVLSLMVEGLCGKRITQLSGYTYTVFLLSYFPQMFISGPIAHVFPTVNQCLLCVVSALSGFFIPILIGIIATKMRTKNRLMKFCTSLIGI